MHQRARRAGAHLALVQREHGEALDGLLLEVVVLFKDVLEEQRRGLAAELEGDRDDLVRRGLVDDLAHLGRAGEGDLGDAVGAGQRSTRLVAHAVDDVQHARRDKVADQIHQVQDRRRGLLRRLEHDRVARSQRRGELPRGHEQREVPRNDLADHTERLVEVVGDGVLVDLAQATLLRAQRTRVVTEVVDGQRDVGGERLAHRLAVLPGFRHGELLEVLLHAVRDLQQHHRALRRGGLAPSGRGLVRGVEREVDVGFLTARDLAEHLAGDGGDVVEVLAVHRGDPVAADVVVVALAVLDVRAFSSRVRVNGHVQAFLTSRSCCGPRYTYLRVWSRAFCFATSLRPPRHMH